MENSDEPDAGDKWQGLMLKSGYDFATICAQLRDNNPYELDALSHTMAYLATELWDRDFSQSEIKEAFEEAVRLLAPYASGPNRR